jgi:rhodanese-related sulfurtransferase
MENINNYWIFGIITAWLIYKWWKVKKITAMLPNLKDQGATFIDVRSEAEFAQGNASVTINIPLQQLSNRIDEISKESPVVLCCASGNRSGMAKMILKKNGYKEVYNIGTWSKLKDQKKYEG